MKYRLKGQKLTIEIKCYNCNTYSYFTVWLNKKEGRIEQLQKKHVNNKHIS